MPTSCTSTGANGVDPQRAHELAVQLVAALRKHSEDHRVPLDLDADLRPEGRNGPIARSLDAYAEYYRRWSLSWEAQALLRARGVAGSVKLIQAFTELADDVRYPEAVDPQGLREIKRIKARVENERLPQGADPARHLKLGPGSLSDVEWLVQLLQLQHAHAVPGMRTTSTIAALRAAADAGLHPRERRRPARRGVAAREPAALREHAAVGADERRAADRPQAPGRHRAAARVPAAVGDAGRGGLPRHDPSFAPRVREALLRLIRRLARG